MSLIFELENSWELVFTIYGLVRNAISESQERKAYKNLSTLNPILIVSSALSHIRIIVFCWQIII